VIIPYFGLHWGHHQQIIIFFAMLFFGSTTFILELIIPYRKDWTHYRKDLILDILHNSFSMNIPLQLFKFTAYGLILSTTQEIYSLLNIHHFWSTNFPLAVQIILALLVTEFFHYHLHRQLHRNRKGYRLHLIHHSLDKMYFIIGARIHPVQALMNVCCMFVPLWTLQFSQEVIFYISIFRLGHGCFQHCNIDYQDQIWRYLFSTPNLHRVHHHYRTQQYNFGSILSIYDHFFRTYKNPNTVKQFQLGTGKMKIPNNYWDHLLFPFKKRKSRS
jgi:sterol desaturase/sphingolipid hydroxylase (fatty acid hydroxylase superfamily)